MLDLEDQIHRVADAAFDRTTPVVVDLGSRRRQDRRRLRLAAVAASILVAVGGAALMAGLRSGDQRVITDEQDAVSGGRGLERFAYLTDPLDLDLDGPIEISPTYRLSSIGPVLSFDLDALPGGWSAEQVFAVTAGLPGASRVGAEEVPGPTYWQQVAVTTPGRIDLVVNIRGPLAPDPDHPDLALTIDGDPIEIRDQPATANFGHLQWIEQDRIVVDIVAGPRTSGSLADVSAEMLLLAESLQPRVTELVWDGGDEMASPTGPARPEVEPLLAGTIAGIAWQVAADGTELQLLVGDDARSVGSTPVGTPDDGTTIHYSVHPIAVPGGAILYGRSPDRVVLVRLHLSNATVDLPVVAVPEDQGAFAVPLSDVLDPEAISFLDGNEETLATIQLAGLPPYLGGVIGSGVSITAE